MMQRGIGLSACGQAPPNAESFNGRNCFRVVGRHQEGTKNAERKLLDHFISANAFHCP
jgi:hypothetical protein